LRHIRPIYLISNSSIVFHSPSCHSPGMEATTAFVMATAASLPFLVRAGQWFRATLENPPFSESDNHTAVPGSAASVRRFMPLPTPPRPHPHIRHA
jgi:hypothetical protein